MKLFYLKKKKMRELAVQLLPDVKIPSLINCSYKFYRWSEWFKFCFDVENDNTVFVDVYHCGSLVVVDLEYRYSPDNDVNEWVFKTNKKAYFLHDDLSFELTYQSEYSY